MDLQKVSFHLRRPSLGRSSLSISLCYGWGGSQPNAHRAGEPNLVSGFSPAESALCTHGISFAIYRWYSNLCTAKKDQIKNTVAILRWFEVVLGLKVNFSRSVLIGVSVEQRSWRKLASIMSCKVGSLPTMHPGLPLCIGSASKAVWNPGGVES